MDAPLFLFDSGYVPDALAKSYRQLGRLHVPNILRPQAADSLYAHLQSRCDWQQVFNVGDKVYELSPADRKAMDERERANLDDAVDGDALGDFQYRYETIRVSDVAAERCASDTVLDAFAEFLCTDNALDWFRRLTGISRIAFADAQATRYRSGSFLTAHDDVVANKDRLAAYIFNFTPVWRAEWGGLLMFHGRDGHIDEGLVPCWNALNIFTVPQVHSVSRVVPVVPVARYSITGWLRG